MAEGTVLAAVRNIRKQEVPPPGDGPGRAADRDGFGGETHGVTRAPGTGGYMIERLRPNEQEGSLTAMTPAQRRRARSTRTAG